MCLCRLKKSQYRKHEPVRRSLLMTAEVPVSNMCEHDLCLRASLCITGSAIERRHRRMYWTAVSDVMWGPSSG